MTRRLLIAATLYVAGSVRRGRRVALTRHQGGRTQWPLSGSSSRRRVRVNLLLSQGAHAPSISTSSRRTPTPHDATSAFDGAACGISPRTRSWIWTPVSTTACASPSTVSPFLRTTSLAICGLGPAASCSTKGFMTSTVHYGQDGGGYHLRVQWAPAGHALRPGVQTDRTVRARRCRGGDDAAARRRARIDPSNVELVRFAPLSRYRNRNA